MYNAPEFILYLLFGIVFGLHCNIFHAEIHSMRKYISLVEL